MEIQNFTILGCGTSLNAGHIGRHFFKHYSGFNSVQIFDGADFDALDMTQNNNGLLLLSQSGETKDLHRCFEIINNTTILSIVNVVDSLIAREARCGIYLNAGREVAVASTKSFTCQVIALVLMSIWFAQQRKLCTSNCNTIIDSLRMIPMNVEQLLDSQSTLNKLKDVAVYLKDKPSCFILGKGINKYIAMEGALKLKEIGYIHAEGYSSSALKHGPFGLLEEGYPVIILVSDDKDIQKVQNAIHEVRARHAKVFTIGDHSSCDILLPKNTHLQCILNVIALQLVAYYLSLEKDINPDFPRNLAKVVTVE